jgi:pimeloyl-ACP methyl ester carboxylesterase
MKNLMACLLVITMSGCPDVQVDPDEVGGGPTVEFDPARSQAQKARFIPFPNDLARDATTGKVNLSEQNCETPASKATRENILNKLDGFGTYETAMSVSFTTPVDEASLADHIVMYQLTKDGMPLTPSASTQPIPVTVVRVGTSPRFSQPGKCALADAEMVNTVAFVPNIRLDQRSTYFVALLKGVTSGGVEFSPSYTWGLVASKTPPVVLDENGNIVSDLTPLDPADEGQRAQLIALAGMWKLHSAGLQFLDAVMARPRTDILVGFQFTTQTVTDPVDPTVANSAATKIPGVIVLMTQTATGKFGPYSALCGGEATTAPAQCFLKLALGGCSPLTTGCGTNNYNAGAAACQLVGCAAVGDVVGGGAVNVNFQTQLPNAFDPARPIQGGWSDPVNPEQQSTVTLETLMVIPAGNPPMNNGWPVVVFGHGLGSSKESALAIAGRLAAAGFATVAIDTAAHGSRAVRVSKDPALGCIGHCFSGTADTGVECDSITQCQAGETCGSLAATPSRVPPSPTTAPQCYAPFLSSDLAAVRDGIRQTVLDHQRIVKAIKACGVAGCNGVTFNPDKIYYAGLSLGAILGTISAATTPDIKSAVINVGGVGWADILENTETLAIRCQLVNGLIDAGILVGDKWNGSDMGLCTTDAWKMQPGWATFSAIGRWVLDPADGANYTPKLAMKNLLIQEVVGDTVVPNIATDRLAALVGLAPKMGDPFNGAPSTAITEAPTDNKFVKYTSDATNVFVHSSLLRPAPTADPMHGINGTLRLVTDAITFLANNQ